MSDVTLMAKIRAMKLTQFSFTNFDRVVSSPDETGKRNEYLVFELTDPIPEVSASKLEFVPALNRRVGNKVTDVTKVSCNLDLVEKYISEFTFDEEGDKLTKTGKYEGDLFLDLSRKEDVWLTDTKFSKMSMDFITKGKQENLMRMLGKHDLIKEFEEKTKQTS